MARAKESPSTQERAQHEALEPGDFGVQLDSGDMTEQPFPDGAEGVMVEGVHLRIEEAFRLRPAVPAFPDGGGAVEDRIEPGRIIIAQKQPVSDVGMAGQGKRGIEVADADEAGA